MAGVPERIFIFHIYRKDGSSLFLHPFAAPEDVIIRNENMAVGLALLSHYLKKERMMGKAGVT